MNLLPRISKKNLAHKFTFDDHDAMVEAIEPLPFIDGIVYGEGPRWHNGRLWFSDGPAGQVCSVGETGDVTVEVELEHASGLGWLPDGTLVVSTLFEAKVHQVDAQGQVAATFDLSDLAWSTNDLVVAHVSTCRVPVPARRES